MARKPSNILYSVDETPPISTMVILAIQHAALALLFVVYPLVAAHEAGLDFGQTQILITGCIIFMGLATILQCLPRYGAGILLVQLPNTVHMPLAVQCMALGGPAMYAGMALVAAGSQLVLTRFLGVLRVVFPPEVCGVAVTMLGVSLASPAIRRTFGLVQDGGAAAIDPRYPLVSLTALTIIVLLAIFSRGTLKLFAVVIGAGAGWILAEFSGLTALDVRPDFSALAVIDLPHVGWPGLAFSWAILPAAILTGIISSIDMIGSVVSMQRIDDADWRRVDMKAAEGAIRGNALGDVGAALSGGFASGSSSGSIGVAFATGVTAWRVGIGAGLLILLAAFSPRLVALLTIIPSPVIGAILLYSAAFLIVAGMDLILSRRLSDRRIFTVGFAVLAGLAVAILPELIESTPAWIRPILESPLSVSTAFAILLNMFFRIGISQEAGVTVKAGDNTFEASTEFLERQGDLWGARRDVIAGAIPLAAEATEMLLDTGLAQDELELRARFDEMNFDVSVLYAGEAIEIPTTRPSPEDLLGDTQAVARFVGYMLSKRADRLVLGKSGDKQMLTLRFQH